MKELEGIVEMLYDMQGANVVINTGENTYVGDKHVVGRYSIDVLKDNLAFTRYNFDGNKWIVYGYRDNFINRANAVLQDIPLYKGDFYKDPADKHLAFCNAYCGAELEGWEEDYFRDNLYVEVSYIPMNTIFHSITSIAEPVVSTDFRYRYIWASYENCLPREVSSELADLGLPVTRGTYAFQLDRPYNLGLPMFHDLFIARSTLATYCQDSCYFDLLTLTHYTTNTIGLMNVVDRKDYVDDEVDEIIFEKIKEVR